MNSKIVENVSLFSIRYIGLKWEAIISKTTKTNDRIYSFRFAQKYRALALREESYLRLLTLHTDHDSAYKK